MNSLINGRPSEQIRADDRGLAYGDGLFETIEVDQGRLVYWQRHLDRLTNGCSRLSIPIPDRSQLLAEAKQLLQANNSGVLKITITRGTGGRGYSHPNPSLPTRLITFHAQPDYPPAYQTQGVCLKVCSSRLGINPQLAGLKHLNRLEQVIARAELDSPKQQEGLMLDYEGHPVEGIMSNLFWVSSGEIFTPDLGLCGVSGVIREIVIELAEKSGIPCRIGRFTIDHLLASDEVFVTNSLIGIWPVHDLDDHLFSIGEVTLFLLKQLNKDKKKNLEIANEK